MKAETTVPASLRDELDEAEQREQLAFWVEAARKALYDLEWAFKNFPELRKHPGLSDIAFPADWNESMSSALQMMHIENSGVLLRAGELLDKLSSAAAQKVSDKQETRHA